MRSFVPEKFQKTESGMVLVNTRRVPLGGAHRDSDDMYRNAQQLANADPRVREPESRPLDPRRRPQPEKADSRRKKNPTLFG